MAAAAVGFLLAGATLAACSQTPASTLPAGPISSHTPDVPRLDTTALEKHPCAALSDEQLKPVVGEIRNRVESSDSCSIVSKETRKPSVEVTLLPISAMSQKGIARAAHVLPVLQPVPSVHGYPAIRGIQHRRTNELVRVCTSIAAVSPDKAVEVDLDASSPPKQSSTFAKHACRGSRELLEQVVANLQRKRA